MAVPVTTWMLQIYEVKKPFVDKTEKMLQERLANRQKLDYPLHTSLMCVFLSRDQQNSIF